MKPQTPTVGQWPPITKPLRERSGLVGIGVFDLEHVAGRGCQNTNGYNGNNISLEEMRGCQTVQILLPKEKDWQAWPDGLKVEATSNFYLTGIAHCQGLILNERLGRVDLDHLMALYNVEKYSPVDGESDPDLLSALNKSWIHHPGDEWLTAKPFYVPQLRDLLERAMNTDPFSLYMHHSTMNHEIKPDHFSCFPTEIKHLILENLNGKEIATLQLASRAFRQLPVSIWYQHVRKDMPWLWEVWSDEAPYFWATVTLEDIWNNRLSRLPTEYRYWFALDESFQGRGACN